MQRFFTIISISYYLIDQKIEMSRDTCAPSYYRKCCNIRWRFSPICFLLELENPKIFVKKIMNMYPKLVQGLWLGHAGDPALSTVDGTYHGIKTTVPIGHHFPGPAGSASRPPFSWASASTMPAFGLQMYAPRTDPGAIGPKPHAHVPSWFIIPHFPGPTFFHWI